MFGGSLNIIIGTAENLNIGGGKYGPQPGTIIHHSISHALNVDEKTMTLRLSRLIRRVREWFQPSPYAREIAETRRRHGRTNDVYRRIQAAKTEQLRRELTRQSCETNLNPYKGAIQ